MARGTLARQRNSAVDYEDSSGETYDEDESRSSGRRSGTRRTEEAATSRRSRDDESESRPRRSSGGVSRRSRDDDGDEDSGSRRSSSRGTTRRSSGDGGSARGDKSTRVGKGWSSVKQAKQERSTYADKFTVETGEQKLIKFLEEEPYFTYYEHWIQEFKGQQRQMSFVCLGEDCPLCDIGDNPKFYCLYNIIDLSGDKPKVFVWYATPDPEQAIEDRADDDKTSPINREDLYFSVSKKKNKNGRYSYSVDPVKERDLDEDWDMDPLTAKEIAELAAGAFDEDVVRVTPRKALREIAEELEED